mmetsp:Transcript_2360/g.5424  ORF Transcript_2360/g.5424 Transcript_2360/m.5424 type:complete len:249 (-) Transcript_2360:97-843(-)
MRARLGVQVGERNSALVKDVGCLTGPAPVVLLCRLARGHGGVALRDPGSQGVLAAELCLDVECCPIALQLRTWHRWCWKTSGWLVLAPCCPSTDAQTFGGCGRGVRSRQGSRRRKPATGRLVRWRGCKCTRARGFTKDDTTVGFIVPVLKIATLESRQCAVGVCAEGLHPCAVVAHDIRVTQTGPSGCFPQYTTLNVAGLASTHAVLHGLHSVLPAIQAVTASPDLAKCPAAQELELLEVLLEAGGQT